VLSVTVEAWFIALLIHTMKFPVPVLEARMRTREYPKESIRTESIKEYILTTLNTR